MSAPGTLLHDGQLVLGDIMLGATDDHGVEWVLERLSGWDDPAPTTGQTEQRASAHGGWHGPAFYAPRVVEVEGSLIASTWEDASSALDRLWSALPLSTPDWLLVAENARTLQTQVRQEGDPLVERLRGWARFSLSLIAADPRRYAVDEAAASTGLPVTSGGFSLPIALPLTIGATTTAGVLTVTNEGNMPAPWTATLTGPVPAGSSITHRGTGKTLRIPHAVVAGRTLMIDSDRRRALLDGTAARVVTGTWFDLEPGVNEIAFSAPSYDAGALLSMSYRSAYH